MKTEINFDATKEDSILIHHIVEKMVNLFKVDDKLSLEMDLTACHLNGCELDLVKLSKADTFTLAHDVWGISDHIDRTTGRLKNHFIPRCASTTGNTALADDSDGEVYLEGSFNGGGSL